MTASEDEDLEAALSEDSYNPEKDETNPENDSNFNEEEEEEEEEEESDDDDDDDDDDEESPSSTADEMELNESEEEESTKAPIKKRKNDTPVSKRVGQKKARTDKNRRSSEDDWNSMYKMPMTARDDSASNHATIPESPPPSIFLNNKNLGYADVTSTHVVLSTGLEVPSDPKKGLAKPQIPEKFSFPDISWLSTKDNQLIACVRICPRASDAAGTYFKSLKPVHQQKLLRSFCLNQNPPIKQPINTICELENNPDPPTPEIFIKTFTTVTMPNKSRRLLLISDELREFTAVTKAKRAAAHKEKVKKLAPKATKRKRKEDDEQPLVQSTLAPVIEEDVSKPTAPAEVAQAESAAPVQPVVTGPNHSLLTKVEEKLIEDNAVKVEVKLTFPSLLVAEIGLSAMRQRIENAEK